jgi:hypothetical protein
MTPSLSSIVRKMIQQNKTIQKLHDFPINTDNTTIPIKEAVFPCPPLP